MKNTSVIRTILFNILVILTILFIYFMFFPKKSYVSEKLNNVTKPQSEEIFNQNMNSMKIASTKYFEENDNEKVTLEELIDNNLLVELKDENGNSCDNKNSYSEKTDDKMSIYLKCSDNEKTLEIDKSSKKSICIYQYEKTIPQGYTEWSDWSDWQLEEVQESELINVEEKVEQELDGTRTVTKSKEKSIDATRNNRITCPEGYSEQNSKCVKKSKLNTITASISYKCPEGYTKNSTTCYKNGNTVSAEKQYYCPTNKTNLEYELSGSNCNVYNVSSTNPTGNEIYYTCPNGYSLSNSKCYTKEYYEDEEENYKDVTYYRFQTREKNNEKKVIKWSTVNDDKLISDEYNMTEEIFCGF